jgi:hypothetical protein
VAGLDTDSVYDPSDINPTEYEFLINFEIYQPHIDEAKVLFEPLCEHMSDYLDANRGIQEHSCVMIYTIHEGYLVNDCVTMTTNEREGREGQYAVASINFAFNPNFHNVKRILQFIYGIYKIGNWNHLTEESELNCLRMNLKISSGNRWKSMRTITGSACETLGLCLNGLGKNLIFRARKNMKDVYNFALYMYKRSSYDFTSQFIDITKIDHISGLISKAIQHVDGGVEGNKKIKSVKLNAKMKQWLSGIVYDEKTINRIASMCTFQINDYTNPYNAPRYESVSVDSWKLCKFFKEQLAKNPRKTQQFALKTIKGGIEFVFVAYLGLFDMEPLFGSDRSVPMQLCILFHGDVYHPEAYAKFESLTCDIHEKLFGKKKFDVDLFNDMFENMIANSNE